MSLLIAAVCFLSACSVTNDMENLTSVADDTVADTSEPAVLNTEAIATETTTASPEEYVGATVYVDGLVGDDANDGSEPAPYQTISEAVTHLNPGDLLIVGEGVYRETVKFPSGTDDRPIKVKAAEGSQPIISGTDVITAEWSCYDGNIYVASVSEEVTDLFVDGKQMNLARWPDAPVDNLMKMEWAMMKGGSDSNQLVDSGLPAIDLTGARVNMIPGDGYISYSRMIVACEPGNSVTFDAPVSSTGDDPVGYDPYVPCLGSKYYIVGALALLDAPGEWYYDHDAGHLYLYTENGDSPANYEISCRTRICGIDLSASQFVRISGIDLFACAVDGSQARYCVLDDVNVTYVDYFLDGNGYDSMYTQRSNHFGGEGNLWQNSKITKAAGNGVLLSGKNNVIDNCNISDVNWSAGYLANVKIEGEGNTVKNCTLKNSGRFIVYHSTAVKAEILNNDISGASLLTRDCGAIYAWGTEANGTEIGYNFVHDNKCVGVYLDNNCSGINVHHNIITENSMGLQLNSQMLDCMIVNNTVIGNNKLQESYCYASDTPSMANSVVANNLYSGAWQLAGGDTAPVLETNLRNTSVNDDFSLPAGHEAIDAGSVIPPYTDGYSGSAPDIGALESGLDVFTYGSTIK